MALHLMVAVVAAVVSQEDMVDNHPLEEVPMEEDTQAVVEAMVEVVMATQVVLVAHHHGGKVIVDSNTPNSIVYCAFQFSADFDYDVSLFTSGEDSVQLILDTT